MPVFGLPKTLETIFNSILQESSLSSYKLTGFGERTTLVIRFDSTMADTGSAKPSHQSTPAYHRKSPSQQRRDVARRTQYLTEKQQKGSSDTNTDTDADKIINMSDREKKKTTNMDSAQFDSGLTSTLDSITSVSESMPSCVSSPVTNGQDSPLITRDTHTPRSLIVNTSHREEAKKQTEIDSESLKEERCTEHTRRGKYEHDTSPGPRSRSSHRSSVTSSRSQFIAENEEKNENLTQTEIEKKLKDNKSIQRFSVNLDTGTGNHISQADRNKCVRKASYIEQKNGPNMILAETDDYIIEYCMEKNEVNRIGIKGHSNFFSRTMSEYMFECIDDTQDIKKDYQQDWSNINVLTACLKRLIQEVHGMSSTD